MDADNRNGEIALARRKQAYDDGEIIYREGEPADGAYEVLSGAVELFRDDGAGTKRANTFKANQIFGEMGLIGGGKRESTARALGPVQVRLINSDTGAYMAQPVAQKRGMLDCLIEQIGCGAPSELTQTNPGPNAEGPGFIQRMTNLMQPMEGRIEARVANFNGDANGIITKEVIAAFDRFQDVHARPLGRALEFNVDEDLTTELSRAAKLARRWLRERQADILIWGHVPTSGVVVHIHFITLANWDDRVPGSFDLTTDLPLPAHFSEKYADFLHAATLSATVPINRDKAKVRLAALPDAAAKVGIAMEDIPPDMASRERAALYLCHGNILTSAWSARRAPELMEQAMTAYRQVAGQVKLEESPVDWAMAYKHLSSLLYLKADMDEDLVSYEESAASALSALEVFAKNETPYEWAALQSRLGLIYYKLGYEAGHTGTLRQALRYHQNALKVYSKRRTPVQWTEVMSSFARTAQVFGEHVKSLEALATAANAYQTVLQVRNRKKGPLAWAATRNNLGSALFSLGKKANNLDRIEAAIDAFEAALEVYELRRKYRQAAVTGKNLDRARQLLHDIAPKGYLSREIMELDEPLIEDPGSNLVDVSDVGVDEADGSTVH